MSSVTTGRRLCGEAGGLAVPLSWAAAAFVLELVLILAGGFIAYGKLENRVDTFGTQGSPALSQHVKDADARYAVVGREVGELKTSAAHADKSLERIEGKVDRIYELLRKER